MHEAKLRATSSADLMALDDAATYLNSRLTMAQRALALARAAREEAVARTLELKKERDQVGLLLDNRRREHIRGQDDAERHQLNELATARYAMAAAGL
jgi:flagellar biosynthesis chaperone FliJ